MTHRYKCNLSSRLNADKGVYHFAKCVKCFTVFLLRRLRLTCNVKHQNDDEVYGKKAVNNPSLMFSRHFHRPWFLASGQVLYIAFIAKLSSVCFAERLEVIEKEPLCLLLARVAWSHVNQKLDSSLDQVFLTQTTAVYKLAE